jgi:large subunit ribosomal protein L24
MPALPDLSGRMTISAAQASLTPSWQATKFASALRFSGSDIVVEDIAGELLGGLLAGEITIRRSSDTLGLQGRIAVTDADATQLLFGDGAAPLTGQAALTLQLEGLGRSPRALVGSLNGTGTLVLDHARIASLDPKVFATATHSVDQGLPIDAPRVRELARNGLDAGPLLVPHADATLIIAAGVARIDSFKARADAADLAVTGAYDFSNGRIDVRLAMSGPADGASLRPEVAVQLRGPVGNPERVLDVSSLTGWLALRSVERQTKKIEAIEQGLPVENSPATPALAPQKETSPQKPDAAVAPPRRKPPQPAVQPLPPAIEIRPSASDRRPQPRAEPQREEPSRPGGANPFPQPIGSPPPPPSAVRPFQPQTVRPIF